MPKVKKKREKRQVERKLLIFCEGAEGKSESAYLNAFIKRCCSFNGKRVDIKVVPNRKNTGKELAKLAKDTREVEEDIVWIVYDKDGYTKHPETFNYSKKHNINIAFSSISFEFWILLHKKYTTKAFNKSEEVIQYIKKQLNIEFKKNDIQIITEFLEDIDTAIKNAEQLRKHQKQSYPTERIYEINPWTDVDLLIKDIKKLEEECPK